MKKINKDEMEALLFGSVILGGGGGGSFQSGQYVIDQAFAVGTPTIVDMDDFEGDTNGVIVTTSAVGAPAATNQYVTADDYNRVVSLMQKELTAPLHAFITNEIGGGSTFNAFIQSATTGLPMLDAACNGRAHPLGTQGAMGLSTKEGYQTIQTAAGGNPATNHYVELTTRGNVNATSRFVRTAADEAGGLVVVARNPVNTEYIRGHAALGAISRTIEVGKAYLAGDNSETKIANAVKELGGEILVQGPISHLELETAGGLDKGLLELKVEGELYRLYILNEYMALDKGQERISTFPDLLMTFDTESGLPLTSAEIKQAQDITIMTVPKNNLLLGAGMFEQSGYEAIEALMDIDLVSYNTDIIKG